jgi:hypothetical protein
MSNADAQEGGVHTIVRLTGDCNGQVEDSRNRGKAYRNMVGKMFQSHQDYAADLHIYAAHGFESVDASLGFMLDSRVQ